MKEREKERNREYNFIFEFYLNFNARGGELGRGGKGK
jgi:hypothetical protein